MNKTQLSILELFCQRHTFSEIFIRLISIFRSPFAHILIAGDLVAGVAMAVLITIVGVQLESLGEVLLDALEVVAEQMTGLGVLLVVTPEPVLNPEVLDVVRDLLRVLEVDSSPNTS